MFFNSYLFILLFLPVSVIGYFVLGKAVKYELAKIWLVVMSFWFYAHLHTEYALLLAGSIFVNYLIAAQMKKQKRPSYKKGFLLLGIILNLGLLFCYKYFDFFAESANGLLGSSIPLLRLLLPVGISFITFQQISYLLDCFKEAAGQHSFLDYALYVSFFPKINSGPITLFRDFLPQVQDKENKRVNYENIAGGLYQFAMGLAKKVLLADTLAQFVNMGFSDIEGLHTISALCVMLCYSLQLYYDFSGYSDMALGIAKILNIKLPINFNSPYKARSVSDFWKRWHITLTHFFTQYVYIPLGGNRKGLKRTCIHIMLVFLLSGLWHGANWTFIVWGCMHGLLLVFERVTDRRIEKFPVFGRIFTFLFVNAAWVIFRADSLRDAGRFFTRIFVWGYGTLESSLLEAMNEIVEIRVLCRLGFQGVVNTLPFVPIALFLLFVLLMALFAKNTQERLKAFCCTKGQMAFTVILLFWSIISLSSVNVFLYSNF